MGIPQKALSCYTDSMNQQLPVRMKPSDWLNLAYFLGMMGFALSGKLIRPTEWKTMIGIEIVRSFTYVFAGGMSVMMLKKMLQNMGAFFNFFMIVFGLMFLVLTTLLIINFATDASRPIVLIFQLLNFYGGLALYLRRSFKEALELEAEEKKGGFAFSFPTRPFARVFFALPGFFIPGIFYGLTFLLEFILIRLRVVDKKA